MGLLMLHQLVIQHSFGRVSTILLRPQEGRKPEINRHTKDLQKQQNRAEISLTDATGRRHSFVMEQPVEFRAIKYDMCANSLSNIQ